MRFNIVQTVGVPFGKFSLKISSGPALTCGLRASTPTTICNHLVQTVGVEPTSLAAHAPEACVFASFTTSAFDYLLCFKKTKIGWNFFQGFFKPQFGNLFIVWVFHPS